MDDKDSQGNRIIEIYQAESTNMPVQEAESPLSDDHTMWVLGWIIGGQNQAGTIRSPACFPGVQKLSQKPAGQTFLDLKRFL
ncbi:hypothetical protein GF1_14170 [Desulfolithobacter dissulfuricans]|uniref:Uncharacterized protein n=1 Tax=Desulfolithobacter dissulfuricans TaxID=2795293 RepID=A0A915XL19_9BACT|nr:hypothetical protein [Desulfolithobacter dissulfuricans]BCO09041.1 hypothetical protein GF1_14170 [Desulfolithobacter dissulfuricans]